MSNPLAGLGRLRSPDPRDCEYLMPRAAMPTAIRKHWHSPGVMDQGATSQCVAYSGIKYLTSGPIVNRPAFTPDALYRQCQLGDEWPGTAYEGTSVRACFKTFRALGYVSAYLWAFEAGPVISHLLTRGPVVMGTTWTVDMSMPDDRGFISFTGQSLGGHAYLLTGVDRAKLCPDGSRGAVRMVNSWGRGWADGGRAFISFADLQRLIEDYGEACVASEVRR